MGLPSNASWRCLAGRLGITAEPRIYADQSRMTADRKIGELQLRHCERTCRGPGEYGNRSRATSACTRAFAHCPRARKYSAARIWIRYEPGSFVSADSIAEDVPTSYRRIAWIRRSPRTHAASVNTANENPSTIRRPGEGKTVPRSVPAASNAPAAAHTTMAGAGRSNTASKPPSMTAMSTTPAPASAASRSSGERAESYLTLSAPPNRKTTNAASAINAGAPRSDSAATQSLLGHGFAVMPVVSESDGSFAGANFG